MPSELAPTVDAMPSEPPSEAPWDRPIYSIGAVARMLDVAASTLRSWEDRYGLVAAYRSQGGQRLYSREQVAQLKFVKSELDRGRRAGEAHRLLEQRLMDSAEPGRLGGPDDSGQEVFVLLVERDPFAAELSEYFLRTEGYGVEVVLDPDAVLRTFDRVGAQLVLVELLMADGQGTALVRQLSDRGARVVAVSPLQLEDEALQAGAEAFLHKPFDPIQLVSTVRDLVGTSALTRKR